MLKKIGTTNTTTAGTRVSRAISHLTRHILQYFLAVFVLVQPASLAAQIAFVNVTPGSGAEYSGESYGGSWGDYNGDGWPDLFVSHHRNQPSLHVNLGDGTFEDRWYEVDLWSTDPFADQHGGAWSDFDNDEDQELFVSTGAKDSSQFLVNNGDVLTDQTQSYTFDKISWSGRLPVWFDFDSDGLLDFALAIHLAKPQILRQVPGDFEKVNFLTGQDCNSTIGLNYLQLADLTNDAMLDLLCSSTAAFPDKIYDITTMPFVDISSLIPSVPLVVDSAIGDFNGDLISDMAIVRGRARPRGAEIVGSNSIEAHLIPSNGKEQGFTFQSDGDVSFDLHWSGRSISKVFIGSEGINTPVTSVDGVLSFTLSSADPNVWGIQAYDPLIDNGVYVGYEPSTQTWQFVISSGGFWSYTYTFVDSTSPVTGLTVSGLETSDGPYNPVIYMSSSGLFVDETQSSGLNIPLSCLSIVSADFDNDMDMDLYMVCRDAVLNTPNLLYENQGDGTFALVASAGGAEGPIGSGVGLGENVMLADYDVDGFIDLFITNGLKLYPEKAHSTGGPDQLFKNSGNANHWIELDLVGTVSNRDGVGAKVYATTGGVSQLREQNGGYHRWAQNHQRIHFGLASNQVVDLQVLWPSGTVDTFTNVNADRLYRVTEAGAIEEIVLPAAVAPSPCVEPVYDKNTEQAVFIWKDCNTDSWHTRMTGGGTAVTYVGDVRANQAFSSVTGVSLEVGDVLDFTTNPAQIDYTLDTGATGQDGFDFTFPVGTSVCFGLDLPNGVPVLLGAARTPVTVPFDLDTFGPCTDLPPVVSIDDVTVAEDDAGGVASFTVSLSAANAQAVTVDVATADGTAVSPGDYTAVALTTLTFNPGETSKPVDVSLIDDALAEGSDETFTVVLSAPANAILGDATGVGTITDNEASPCDTPVYDKNAEQAVFLWKDCATGAWQARMTGGSGSATFEGSVIADQAFSSVTGFSIEVSDVLDFTTDPNQIAYTLNVANGGGVQDGFDFTFPAGAAVCFGLDSPSVPVLVGAARTPVTVPFDLATLGPCTNLPTVVSIDDVTVDEDDAGGVASFTVSLSAASTQAMTVDVATADGTAVSPGDYTAVALTTLTFNPGETSKPVDVALVNDALAEGDETFTVVLSTPTNAILGDATGVGTITDNEASPCDTPVYDRNTEQAVFLWKDCGTGAWQARMTGGSGSATFEGSVIANQAFSSVVAFSVEVSSDVLDFTTDPNQIAYTLNVANGGGVQDGFDFTFPAGAAVCFGLDSPSVPVLVGAARTPVTVPFDLATLGPCTNLPTVVSIDDVTVAEDDAGGVASFTVSLSAASIQAVTVDVATADGTAVSPGDYTAVALTTLTFNAGETSKPVDVALGNDALAEGDETFTVVLSTPTNAILGDATGVGTITDNEASPCDTPVYDKNTEQAMFLWKDCATGAWQARMTGGSGSATFEGSVIADQAFSSVTGFSIEVSDVLDFTTDPNQIAYTLNVANGGGVQDGFDFTFPAGAAVCFGLDSPSVPVLVGAARTPVTVPFDLATLGPCTNLPTVVSIDDVTVDEDDAGGVASFTVSLSAASTQAMTVDVATADGTAVSPGDYTAVPLTTLTFNAGETSKPVDVALVNDALAEGDETFTVVLSTPTNAILGDATGVGTITDNEASPCDTPVYDRNTEQAVFLWKDCGTGAWQARMTGGSGSATFEGSVIADQAFSSVTGFSIEVSDVLDFTTDPNQIAYTLNVANGGGVQDGFDFTFPAGAAVCFGLDSPSVPVLVGAARTPVTVPFDLATLGPCTNLPTVVSIDDVTVDEDDAGGVASFTVSLSAASTQAMTVDVATADGTAVSPGDYTAVPLTTLTFNAGETSKPVDVALVNDALAEGDETFTVVLSTPTNAILGDATGVGTITDNEASPCDTPVYDRNTEQAVFLWKDCGTGAWQARMTGGSGSATFEGSVIANQAFSSVVAFSVEVSSDVLDFTTDPNQIAYTLNVANGGGVQDGFDFTFPAGAAVCFGLDSPSVPVLVGAARTPVTVPFDLATLGPCPN